MSDTITPEVLDAYHHLSDQEWTLYKCSDCDPEHLYSEEDTAPDGERYDTAFQIVAVTGTQPDHCPRCSSYLSLLDQMRVYVSTAERTP